MDLIINETIDESIAAYLWMLMENKMSVMIVGPTGAGKTTALNAIACLVRPDFKMISVEEVQEINLPQENWVSTIATNRIRRRQRRRSHTLRLNKSAVRHRPALILVGEIRGEEAYVLFQALATGHGGLCTMHADDVETVIKRLTQPPMNIPQNILSLMNCVIVVKQVKTSKHQPARTEKFLHENSLKLLKSITTVFPMKCSTGTCQQTLSSKTLDKSYLLQ